MAPGQPQRQLTLGRRIESAPRWLFVLVLTTAVVVVLAVVVGFRGHSGADGFRCGAAFSPRTAETQPSVVAGCSQVLADAQRVAFPLAGLAVAMVVAALAAVIVRGWGRREPAPWPSP